MQVPELLEEIGRRGVHLFPKEGRLRFGPKRNMTPELLEELKEHKVEILAIIGEEPVRSASEVLEMARALLGPSRPFDPSEHPPTLGELWTDPEKERLYFPERFIGEEGART
jgi:hypothetical protein